MLGERALNLFGGKRRQQLVKEKEKKQGEGSDEVGGIDGSKSGSDREGEIEVDSKSGSGGGSPASSNNSNDGGETSNKPPFVASIDQGTSSSRCMVFDREGSVLAEYQMEHEQFFPRPGCVEHDAEEIWKNVSRCVKEAMKIGRLKPSDLAAVGITNQRESTLVWDKTTGKPFHRLIVWNDVRTESICSELKLEGGADRFRERTGLPISPYFSATKLLWLFKNVPGLREAAQQGDALFGTMDSWLMWKLTGGRKHITDVTNASRTLLMSLEGLHWDQSILEELDIPACMLPEIVSSSEVYCEAENDDGVLNGVRIAGILGDQQAALFGQACFGEGETKCTYGTGSFILMNTGHKVVPSTHGLLSTVGFKLGEAPCVYALEGSIAYSGSTVQWLRDNLTMIKTAPEIEDLARSVKDNGGVYFVPAFAGLLAPHWRGDARGLMCGLTAFNTKGHVARAVLESTAFQVHDVLEAMVADSGVNVASLRADGGMTANTLLMQFQADLLDVQVLRPSMSETTALGAAFAAGLAVGVWENAEELEKTWTRGSEYVSSMDAQDRNKILRNWKRAVQRSLGWHTDDNEETDEWMRDPKALAKVLQKSQGTGCEKCTCGSLRNSANDLSAVSIGDWWIKIAIAAGVVVGIGIAAVAMHGGKKTESLVIV